MASNNSAVHILFVCGMGMGTSTMAELGVKRNLVPLKITAELQHTSLGMMESLRDWADRRPHTARKNRRDRRGS